MKNIESPKLRCTKDYGLFELHPYNRDLHDLKKLEKSVAEYGFDEGYPIRCVRNGNGKLKITSGHNRFHVARSLGLSVWYIVARRDIPLFDSEASGKQWTVRDFTVARSRAGEKGAELALQYSEETGIPLGCSLSLVGGEGAGSGNMAAYMKAGKFRVGDLKHATAVASIIDECARAGVDFSSDSKFVKAVSKALFVPKFDLGQFLQKVRQHIALMEKRRSIEDYLDLIELVYNRDQKKERLNVAFLANEESRKRAAVKIS